jgi:cytochrome P450
VANETHLIDYPSSAEHAGELPPVLDDARHQASWVRTRLPDGRTAWLVTRYEDVRTVLADERFTREVQGMRGSGAMRTVNMDGRPHLELRNLVSKDFTARRIERMQPRVQAVADGLLDSLTRQGRPADVVQHVAAPLPAIVICELMGFPAAEHQELSRLCDRVTTVGADVSAAWSELSAYIDRAVDRKRAEMAKEHRPEPDLLSTLIRAHDDRKLSEEELVSLTIVVLAGGLETTQTAISAGLLRLFRNNDELVKLRADPRLLESTIEEILRYQPVVDTNRLQVATQDVVLGGQRVLAGELVQISINAANRDEEIFAEGGRFEIDRQPNPHLAFGHGGHHCLGAALARLELRTVFSSILCRFPRLRLAAPPQALRWRGGHVTLRLETLPVTW